MEVHCGFIYQSNALNETAIHLPITIIRSETSNRTLRINANPIRHAWW